MSAGYSGTPLVKKLGIKAGDRVALLHMPPAYHQTLGPLPEAVTLFDALDAGNFDFVQAFYTERLIFEHEFALLRDSITYQGMIWISWPKKAAKIPTDLNENLIREFGLANGLVDVKVAAVDAVWSGLKFVYRLKDRK